MSKPEIVCLCGSVRFEEDWHKAELMLELAGYIVLSIGFGLPKLPPQTKRRLDELHRKRIDMCDWIYVINKGGYIGRSTKSEMFYAQKMNKRIKLMEPLP